METAEAIEAALKAREEWLTLSWIERASIMLKAAELLSKKYRYTIVAATMLGQSKTVHQAEVEAACETTDFLRFNACFAGQIYQEQPRSATDQMNRVEYRPLEGFVYTITPFNFTAIASNLNMTVAIMGNTTVWKPATTSLLSSWILMKVFMEAGMPAGVINFLPGQGSVISSVMMNHRELWGIHFTGSNGTFNSLWKTAAANLDLYRSYPRIVGETLHLCNETSPYGLTGSIFSTDRPAMVRACLVLRYAAGNFYINDKPTGAMVGLQPFGGARASGSNDKAGGRLNLIRWTSPRTIKETFLPATDFRYPYMD